MEGTRLEENAEMENALATYQRVLNFDPGLSELALRVAALLSRQGDYPRAIDVLKDAIKARPKDGGPYLQLAFIYAKYLRKTDQAVKYANQAIVLDPLNFEAYQRLYEIEVAAGQPQKALQTIDRAANVKSQDPAFWIRLGVNRRLPRATLCFDWEWRYCYYCNFIECYCRHVGIWIFER